MVTILLDTIKSRREALNYSTDYVAAKLGVSKDIYQQLELSQRPLTFDTLLEICGILDIDIKELLIISQNPISARFSINTNTSS